MGKNINEFRKRLRSGKPLIGTFIKTPSSIVANVLAYTDLDVFCIDTEHAPFGRLEADLFLLSSDQSMLLAGANALARSIP